LFYYEGRFAVEVREASDGLQLITVVAPEFDAIFEVWGNCPIQGIGSARGRDLYFRARHDGWSFDVADHAGNFPSDGFPDSDGFYRQGKYPNAGWMPHREAVAIIERCLLEYTRWRAEPASSADCSDI
jgi:hypothetical protein